MTSWSSSFKEIQEEHNAGFLPTGTFQVFDRNWPGTQMFLLAPGGQDFAGDNSYDTRDSKGE